VHRDAREVHVGAERARAGARKEGVEDALDESEGRVLPTALLRAVATTASCSSFRFTPIVPEVSGRWRRKP
jgi:hypothetical protein